jgi:hypothetical protein
MAKSIFQNITAIINSIFDVISQGSLERVRVVREFNKAFNEAYLTGEFDRMCKVSIAIGDSSFRHSMSTFVLRSGFKITIQNDEKLTNYDIQEIAKYVLASNPFVRQLMALGFDTLIIIGKNMSAGVKLQLSNFANPNQYFLS